MNIDDKVLHSLDAIAQEPALALKLPTDAAAELLLRSAVAQAALTAAFAVSTTTSTKPAELLTAPQVAARLNFKIGRIYELARSGKLKSLRFDKSVRFSEAHIEEYLAAAGKKPLRSAPPVRAVRRVK